MPLESFLGKKIEDHCGEVLYNKSSEARMIPIENSHCTECEWPRPPGHFKPADVLLIFHFTYFCLRNDQRKIGTVNLARNP